MLYFGHSDKICLMQKKNVHDLIKYVPSFTVRATIRCWSRCGLWPFSSSLWLALKHFSKCHYPLVDFACLFWWHPPLLHEHTVELVSGYVNFVPSTITNQKFVCLKILNCNVWKARRWYGGSSIQGPCAIWDSYPKRILNPNLMKSRLPKTYFSITQSF